MGKMMKMQEGLKADEQAMEQAIMNKIEPERLKNMTPAEQPRQDKPQAPQKPTEAQPIQSIPEKEKPENKANMKPEKQSFSFRADIDKINHWKSYAAVVGTKDIGTLWTAALDEYIINHALTAEQQADYDDYKRLMTKTKK